MNESLSQRIHGTDVFAGFDPNLFPEDIQGWHSEHPVLCHAIEQKRPRLIVEVGVWKGASTIYMAEQMRRAGIAGGIIAVDTFLGGLEHLLNPDYKAALRPRHGWPNLYLQFLANIMHRGLQDVVCPLPQISLIACRYLLALGLQPDMVHIDASHDHDSVQADLNAWFGVLAPGGVLIGDDFLTVWPEVIWAATEFAAKHKLLLQHSDGKFVIQKPL